MAQLPPLDVCEVTRADDEVFDEVAVVAVVAVADDESSSDSFSPDDDAAEVEELAFVALAAVWVVAAWPSCQASTPPSESIDATLSAAAALRARAAFGLRRRRAPADLGTTGAGVRSVESFMPATLRTAGEQSSRAG